MFGNYNVQFTTTSVNSDILENASVKAAIKSRMAIATDADYALAIANNSIKMRFDIFFSATNTVKVNGGIANVPIEDAVYSSGDFVIVKSIVIGTATTATLSFNI